jgi:regulator of protease activity HflC (stomatin/prohibitin superfamily)
VFNQRAVFTASPNEGSKNNDEISFNTRDSVPVNMDVAVNYTLKESAVPAFYTKFRADNINTFTHGYLRDMIRTSVSQIGSEYVFDELNGTKKEEFLRRISKALADSVSMYGVEINPVNGISVIGSLRPPTNLLDAVNQKVQAIQDAIKVENELRGVTAQAKKAVAQAEGISASNKALAISLTPTLMEWERLQIQKATVAKWNGVNSTTVLSGGSAPMINIK